MVRSRGSIPSITPFTTATASSRVPKSLRKTTSGPGGGSGSARAGPESRETWARNRSTPLLYHHLPSRVGRGCASRERRANPTTEENSMRKMREAVIVATARTGLAKSFRGSFNQTRPDDQAAHVMKAVLAKVPKLDPEE